MAAKAGFRYFSKFNSTDEHFGTQSEQKEKCGILVNKDSSDQKRKSSKLKTPEEKQKFLAARKDLSKKRKQKKKRLIIRNLSFKVNEEELKKTFSKFGPVVDITIPKKADGLKKGFAFVQFENFKSAIQAIKNLNFKELHGRPIAVDFALSKDKYEHNIHSNEASKASSRENQAEDHHSSSDDKEEEEDAVKEEEDAVKEELAEDVKQEEGSSDSDHDENTTRKGERQVKHVLKELDFEVDSDEETVGESDDDDGVFEKADDEDSEMELDKNDESNYDQDESVDEKLDKGKPNKQTVYDTQEGKTVFVKNISFETTNEGFAEAMEEFGTTKYCLLCMDPVTELPRGTAFVKFENKNDAEKLIRKASEEGEGLHLDGRRLFCDFAVSRGELQAKMENKLKQKKDKRNLRLLKEGLIMLNTPEAEGVSQSDMTKRERLERIKKQKLKNLNFFVSDNRLCVHNIPKTYSDIELRKLFKGVVDRRAVITEARIMRDMKKVNTDGTPRSSGFGFVAFKRHDDALQALQKLNNNPSVFNPQNRPIVEFSIENHMALLSKQRRQEKSRFRNNKRGNTEEESQKTCPVPFAFGRKPQKFSSKISQQKKMETQPQTSVSQTKDTSSPPKKKNRKRKGKNNKNEESHPDIKELESFRSLTKLYRKKLYKKMK